MPKYNLLIKPEVRKKLQKIPEEAKRRIELSLDKLIFAPRPHNNYKKLKGRTGYRVRVGDYRITYDIDDDKFIVYVLKVGHRKDIYK